MGENTIVEALTFGLPLRAVWTGGKARPVANAVADVAMSAVRHVLWVLISVKLKVPLC